MKPSWRREALPAASVPSGLPKARPSRTCRSTGETARYLSDLRSPASTGRIFRRDPVLRMPIWVRSGRARAPAAACWPRPRQSWPSNWRTAQYFAAVISGPRRRVLRPVHRAVPRPAGWQGRPRRCRTSWVARDRLGAWAVPIPGHSPRDASRRDRPAYLVTPDDQVTLDPQRLIWRWYPEHMSGWQRYAVRDLQGPVPDELTDFPTRYRRKSPRMICSRRHRGSSPVRPGPIAEPDRTGAEIARHMIVIKGGAMVGHAQRRSRHENGVGNDSCSAR